MHILFDSELIGTKKPIFLVCAEVYETGERHKFWFHKSADMKKLEKLLLSKDYTWVGFNSRNFDIPLVNAATDGLHPVQLKKMAQDLIEGARMPWHVARDYDFEEIEDLDHIDLFEVAPGVKISLKTYMGRLGYPTLVDMPFHHTDDLEPKDLKIVESYCWNDIGGTKMLFEKLQTEIKLRKELGAQYGLDLRSKSDAQCAEAIFKKLLGLTSKQDKFVPNYVEYRAPEFIQTESPVVNTVLDLMENTEFVINKANGSPIEPEWMSEPVALGKGLYKVGLGGLHSQHDVKLHRTATDKIEISDFDVASYYPNIIMKAGLVPMFGGDRGERFLAEYANIYAQRKAAKDAGNKVVANSLKILLNGTYGKLGSIFSAFYAPDLMLAVTLTGQLNLMCLIYELEKIKGVTVLSANTDGIMVEFPTTARKRVLKVFAVNSKRTGFEYEETPYRTVAMKDVNNYVAVTTDGKVKSKGLYASNDPAENPLYLMKNPTMEVCTRMVKDYLSKGWLPEESIEQYDDMRDYVAIRNVKGGGVQHKKYITVDDWELIEDHGSAKNVWSSATSGKQVKRKSRPAPYEHGIGGTPFGRVARWYMTTKQLPPITYVESNNTVPKTTGAMLCMTLPTELPKDLDRHWYIKEAYSMLSDMGIEFDNVL